MTAKLYTIIPENHGECPVCNGSGLVRLTPNELRYSWNKDRVVRDCTNCGGQYMWSKSRGYVKLNKSGVACTHKYSEKKIGNCLHEYTCSECGDRYEIDSGD